MATRCSSCGQPILITLTPGHQRLPLEAEPSTAGTIEVRGGYAIALTAAQLEAARLAGRLLYVPHRPNCHDFARWRKSL